MYGKSERLSLIIITVCMPNLTGPGQVYSCLCVSFVFFSLQRHRGLVHEQFLLLNASGYSYSLLLESMPNVSAAVANRTSRAIYYFYNDDSLNLRDQSPPYFGVTFTVSAFSVLRLIVIVIVIFM